MPRTFRATEDRGLDETLEHLPATEAFLQRALRRFRPFIRLEPPARVLDIGAAQGLTVAAFSRAGFVAAGVEPSPAAIGVARELGERLGIELDIRPGVGESLPFEAESFHYVHAYSVMEHVDDPRRVFEEAYRVLRPGGGFFFSTTSAICPRQAEIARFPLFPWYPPTAQKAIMRWAARERPWLVGYTTRPAMHWFKHRRVRADLRTIGYTRTVDKWEFRAASGELTGARQLAVATAASNPVLRFVGNIAVGGVEFLAVK